MHRFLGTAALLSGLTAASLGWMLEQTFNLYKAGLQSFFTKQAHELASILLPIIGVLLYSLAVLVMLTFTVYDQHALPTPSLPYARPPEEAKTGMRV